MLFFPQQYSIANIITTVGAMCINIIVLLIMRFLDPLSYCFHLIFHFLDHLWFHRDPILKSIPTQKHPTWSPIKKLKRGHLNGALLTVLISEFYQWQEFFPMLMLVHHVHVKHVFQDLVCLFGFLFYIRVIRGTKVKLGSQGLLETSPKLPSKHRFSIGYNPLRNAM
jgi:hypothetical protein